MSWHGSAFRITVPFVDNPSVSSGSPHKCSVVWSFDVLYVVRPANCWTNCCFTFDARETPWLPCDVTVMVMFGEICVIFVNPLSSKGTYKLMILKWYAYFSLPYKNCNNLFLFSRWEYDFEYIRIPCTCFLISFSNHRRLSNLVQLIVWQGSIFRVTDSL